MFKKLSTVKMKRKKLHFHKCLKISVSQLNFICDSGKSDSFMRLVSWLDNQTFVIKAKTGEIYLDSVEKIS